MTLVKPKVYHGNIPLRHLNTFPYFPSVSSFRELKRQIWQNSKFARASRFFCTFLCCRCTTRTWKCLISRFVEEVNKRHHPELWYSLHFFTDVFVAVAVLFITLIAREFRRKAVQSSAWTVTWERRVRSNFWAGRNFVRLRVVSIFPQG